MGPSVLVVIVIVPGETIACSSEGDESLSSPTYSKLTAWDYRERAPPPSQLIYLPLVIASESSRGGEYLPGGLIFIPLRYEPNVL